MPAKPVILYPDPLLRTRAADIENIRDADRDLIRDLWDTLDAHAGVGLAAPQIGALYRIIVVDATRARRPVPNHGRLTLLNPTVLLNEGRISFREGCMSIPDLVAHVPRAEKISVAALLPDGSQTVIEAEGFEAVVLQHEIDHLDGVLFIDRVKRARDIKPRS
jgi:peptide deformylase